MATRIAIIHFQPLELYPPILNLLKYIDGDRDFELKVFTTAPVIKKNNYEYSNIQVKRFRNCSKPGNIFNRAISYLGFYVGTFFGLIKKNPDIVFYYETESSFPAYLYILLNRKKLMIHYREYNDSKWYKNTARHIAWFHRLEKKYLYKKAIWISQTNEVRLQFFLQDINADYDRSVHHTFPNYPPRQWRLSARKSKSNDNHIKLVYTGTLSLEGSFLDKLVTWVLKYKERISLTLYSYNISPDALQYFQGLDSDSIILKPDGIHYHEMPAILRQYDYGLIIYKTLSSNYVYNIPNKFFEYLACGIGVIFPNGMNLMKPYINQFPDGSIIQADFEKLDQETLAILMEHKSNGLEVSSPFFCESVFSGVIEKMKN